MKKADYDSLKIGLSVEFFYARKNMRNSIIHGHEPLSNASIEGIIADIDRLNIIAFSESRR